ncbi:hypothetical protein, partial [Mycoplasmopsis bovis]|uniref:hypothetical protein n=1 Tax=Mycoplasmopsis bovis TaxID=28903 RepID=UPI003D277D6A
LKMNSHIDDESVDLVITSPPYPMIKMWDEIFSASIFNIVCLVCIFPPFFWITNMFFNAEKWPLPKAH